MPSHNQEETVVVDDTREWLLSPLDRCDTCNAEALVSVKGVSGALFFCGHHYNKIMNNPAGYEKMMAFMYEIIDERDKLIEDRAKGVSY